MVVIELGSPEKIIGYKPRTVDEWVELEAGEHTIPVEFHVVVPAGETYKIHMMIDITGKSQTE